MNAIELLKKADAICTCPARGLIVEAIAELERQSITDNPDVQRLITQTVVHQAETRQLKKVEKEGRLPPFCIDYYEQALKTGYALLTGKKVF